MLGPFYSSEVLPPFLAEQASQTCWGSHPDLLNKPLRLAGQASLACRTSFLKRDGQVWAFVLTGGPREKMDPTFVGHVDVLDLPTGPLGLLGLISQFTQFTLFTNKQMVRGPAIFPSLRGQRERGERYSEKEREKSNYGSWTWEWNEINATRQAFIKEFGEGMTNLRNLGREWRIWAQKYLLKILCLDSHPFILCLHFLPSISFNQSALNWS